MPYTVAAEPYRTEAFQGSAVTMQYVLLLVSFFDRIHYLAAYFIFSHHSGDEIHIIQQEILKEQSVHLLLSEVFVSFQAQFWLPICISLHRVNP